MPAAFPFAELSTKGELEHHASYLRNWLGMLKQDKTTLLRTAADASRATEYLHSLQPPRMQNGLRERPKKTRRSARERRVQ